MPRSNRTAAYVSSGWPREAQADAQERAQQDEVAEIAEMDHLPDHRISDSSKNSISVLASTSRTRMDRASCHAQAKGSISR